MKAVKERITCILFVLIFLLVIAGINVIGYYDRTFYDCSHEISFSLNRGVYRVTLDEAASADAYRVYYEVNGQERILAQGDVENNAFEITLPSNIRNDSVRVTAVTEEGTNVERFDAVRITKVLPVGRTVAYLAMYLVIAALIYAGFRGRREVAALLGAVSVAMPPLYPVFCVAPV